MTDKEADFATFVQNWCAENLGSLGDHTDPSDHQYYYGRRAERLREDADAAGFSLEVQRVARANKGGLRQYVEGLYERAEFRRRHGDI